MGIFGIGRASGNQNPSMHPSIMSTRSCTDDTDTNQIDLSFFVEKQKHSLLRKDVQLMKWFRKHKHLSLFLSLLGFYLIYLPTTYFAVEQVQLLNTYPRNEMIKDLPSDQFAKENQISNPSRMYSQMIVGGKR